MQKQFTKKYYGLVEGFFSVPLKPWSWKERLETLAFLKKYCLNFNTYFYCPKNDPYITKQWEALYPKRELKRLKKLITHCQKQNIDFIYGFNPNFKLKKIIRKIEQLQSIGVKNFCLLYDDIPLAYKVTENSENKVDYKIGVKMSNVCNVVKKNISGELWLCAPDYFFRKKTLFLKGLLAKLDPRIPLIWTGEQIFTKTITAKMYAQTLKILKNRELIWWNNYPVNDCEHPMGTFHVGSFQAPKLKVDNALQGILLNPMREAAANYPVYLTFENFLKNRKNYDPEKALTKSFKSIFVKNAASIQNIYETFCQKNIVDDAPRAYFKQLLKAKTLQETEAIVVRIKNDLKKITPLTYEDFAKKFFYSTYAILIRAELYVKLFNRIILNNNWRELFYKTDAFPVVFKKTYLNKLYKVLKLRINAFAPELLTTKYYILLKRIYAKYVNKSKLTISSADERKLFKNLDYLIKTEQNIFLKRLNSLPAQQKIKVLIKRNYLNGY